MIASILSKKKSAGATHVLMDIPVGPTAKITTEAHGKRLKARMERVGAALDMEVKVILTDGSEPIGHGIGPALEARDIMMVLRGEKGYPERLKEKAIEMAEKDLENED